MNWFPGIKYNNHASNYSMNYLLVTLVCLRGIEFVCVCSAGAVCVCVCVLGEGGYPVADCSSYPFKYQWQGQCR